MDKCIESILLCGDDIELIIVDDGSTKDNTAEIAYGWQKKYPDIIKVISKENAGHGSAVNEGLKAATGLYFKVVDSDDWLDEYAMKEIMSYVRRQLDCENPTDMIVGNYVYEKVFENKRTVMRYRNVFPEGREFGWEEVGTFGQSQYLLMHAVIYRTQMLKDKGISLPEHCFYVDNIFVYVPLPQVKTIYYRDVDMYRYFIGREGQSVNEDVMISRIDQQLRITKIMIDSVKIPEEVPSQRLAHYMTNYLSMMMCICSIFLRMQNAQESEGKRKEIWNYLKAHDENLYVKVRHSLLNLGTNIPTAAGRCIGIIGYRLAQKIFKFN